MSRTDPLPLEAVRDLLGICRALFSARKREHAPKAELEELREIGSALVKALELARRTEPNTVGHRSAWDRAEMATERLMRIVSATMTAGPVVEGAVVRVRRVEPRVREADARRVAERVRR